MIKRNNISRLIRSGFLVAILLATFPSTVRAYDVQFYQSNDILYYLPNNGSQCVGGTGSVQAGPTAGSAGANDNKDYKGRTVIPDEQMEKIKKFQPMYEKAQAETGVPWQIFAVIHIRESVLADFNPDNGQGIYQDFERGGGPYPPGKVTDEEFLRQTIYAGKIVEQKSEDKFDLVKKGDPDAIKFMFFGYNGRATGYVEQAVKLGFTEEQARNGEGSPYVMNIADEKRDPEVAGADGTWGQVKYDLGPIEYPANGDYGAFVMYAALAGIPSGGGSNVACAGLSTGTRLGDLVVYYQDEEPWASKPYGDTILRCGCGPTSMAMAIATINNDETITPETMANFFVENGYLHAGCGTQFQGSGDTTAFGTVQQEFGVVITDIGSDIAKAAEALKRGSLVYVSADGCPFACAGGHILLLRGMTDDGKFLVADPNKNWGEREDTPWPDSDKTHYEEGFEIKSASEAGINYMWEIRKG